VSSNEQKSSSSSSSSSQEGKKDYSHLDGEIRKVVRQAINDSLLEKGLSSSSVSSSSKSFPIVKVPTNPVVDRNENIVILVCGTAFIMAEARAEIGIEEPKDGDVLAAASGYNLPQLKYTDAQVMFFLYFFHSLFFKKCFYTNRSFSTIKRRKTAEREKSSAFYCLTGYL
jgi:hypothetical protein